MLLDGKKVSEYIKEEIKKEVQKIDELGLQQPGLAVLMVGENKASEIYVNSKIKYSADIGIYSKLVTLPEDITQIRLEKEIEELNNDENIHGILVQLPLPKHLDSDKVIKLIKPEKDVDCFTKTNIGKIFLGDNYNVAPCTPAGIIELLKKSNIDILGKDVTIIGRSNIVGKPLALMMINEGATVTVCHSKTKSLDEKTRNADILIACVGQKHFIKKEMAKPGAVVIDVGINRVDGKICGDVDFDEVSKIASYITPVPGGVGPMTVAMLFKNCMNLYKKEVKNAFRKSLNRSKS